MHKSLIIIAAITVATAPTAIAESTNAYCTLTWHNSKKESVRGPCLFKKDQVNIFIDDFNFYKFGFPASHQSATFNKGDGPEILSFKREGHYTLKVYRENLYD